jgi:hypothetical protein
MSHFGTTGRRLALLAFLALLTFAISAFGQGSQASVAGVVRDASGAVIPGATVTLTNTGTNRALTTTTSGEGTYNFPLISNGKYFVTAEKDGFQKATYRDVEVLPAKQYSLNITMQVGSKTETVEVTAGQDLINTASSEIAGSVDQKQILNLPLLGRNPIELIRTQAGTPGILDATRNTTTINGGRPGWTQTSQDGININDNFIRNNANDFVPNRPTSDTIAEFSIVTNNVGADSTAGTSQVRLVTPAGTNAFHGSVYEYNRNSALAANDYWNKHTDNPAEVIPKDFLNQNQFGARLGGRLIKDKLFFFGSYEGLRLRQQTGTSMIVPKYDDYKNGVYTLSGGLGTVNVLNAINQKVTNAGSGLPTLGVDPQVKSLVLDKVPGASFANRLTCGDNRNTTCYQFQQANPLTRNQEAFRFDYNMTQKHSLEFVFQRFTDMDARTDIDNINPNPLASLSTNTKLFVGAWRWIASPTLVNELRVGDNHSVVPFLSGLPVPNYLFAPAANNAPTLTGLGLTSPTVNFLPQGRDVTTRQYIDNATWTKGAHSITFGGSYSYIAPHTYNYAGVVPTVTMGFDVATVNNGYLLSSADVGTLLPAGTTQADIDAMNGLAAFLSGHISSLAQTFQAKDAATGYVNGYPNKRTYQYSIWSPYVQDTWRIKSNLTLVAGLKYEYWTPLTELNTLGMLPVLSAGESIKDALLDPNGKVAPAKQFWQPDRKQFAPNFGFAWDPFKDGKTSIRGGYSLAYVNEDLVTAGNNAGSSGNSGMSAAASLIRQTAVLGTDGVPVIPTPEFKNERSYLDNLALSVTAAAYGIDPHIRTPYAHQISFEIQREVKWNTAIYARYVGTLGRDLWRGIDYNQEKITTNSAFWADFNRARSNYFNCGGDVYGNNCAAGQPLQWFPLQGLGGYITNSTIKNYIRDGRPGAIVDFYIQNRSYFPGTPQQFLANPNIYVADELLNGARSNYHALQLEARRAMKNGLQFQFNYTFSKLLSDAAGNSQARFEPFIDNANPGYEYGRSEYDLTHVINSNFVYELPIGRGKSFLGGANGILDKFVGGWSMSSIIRWQSGNPLSFLAASRGVFNRPGREAGMPAYSTLTPDQIKGLLGLHEKDGILYWIDPSVISSNGSAVLSNAITDYTPTFTGQVFYNPQPGQLGNLRRLQFNGPGAFSWDFSAAKSTKITERFATEFRADFFNFLNRTNFALYGDYNINSTSFGQVTSTLPNRVIQMSLRVTF